MLFNLSVIILVAMLFSSLFQKIKLPPLLGMILTGVLLGPFSKKFFMSKGFKSLEFLFISDKILDISSELRTAALIVILIRAGLGINRDVLNKIGIPALKMSFIPCILEGTFIIFAAHYILGFSFVLSGVLAFIIAAVSPAVIVPEMLNLKESGYGKKKEIPTLILAGASIDDVFAITLFSSFLGMALGKNVNIAKSIFNIPISIILGIVIGIILGYLLLKFFKKYHMRDTKKVLVFMMVAIMFHHIEELKIIPLASLLGIMAIGFIILEKNDDLAKRMALKFNKVWVLAEILLFVLIGAAVNINLIFKSGILGLVVIAIGLIGRTIAVYISLAGSNLNNKEKLFCAIAYLPKATVQAAIGGIPYSMGVQHGDIMLAIAVLSIVVTAPLGAIGIRLSKDSLLEIN